MELENKTINEASVKDTPVQNMSAQEMSTQDTDEKKDKMSKKQVVGLVVLSLIALGGVLFGVFGMTSQNEQVAQLKAQAEEAQEKVAKLETEKVTITEPDGGTVEITDSIKSNGGPYIENGYFYVPEWGLKFSIPDDLANYGYSVNYDKAQMGYTLPSIGFSAVLASDIEEGAQARYYDSIETCAIVNVTKESADWNKNTINGTIKQFNDYKLLIWNYTRHDSCDYNLHIDEVQNKIQEMFSNPESY